jgi:hypothetical protein
MEKPWQELALELASKLGYKISDNATQAEICSLLEIIQREEAQQESNPHQQLRLGLARGINLAKIAIPILVRRQRVDVLIAFRLDEIFKQASELLFEIQDMLGRKALCEGLLSAFGRGWLHDLLRAQLHLNFFFQGKEEFEQIREAVSVAADSIKAVLPCLQVDLEQIEVFGAIPPGSDLTLSEPGFRRIPEIGQRVVRGMFPSAYSGNKLVVLDVPQFGFTIRDGHSIISRVVPAYYGEWETEIAKWRSKN